MGDETWMYGYDVETKKSNQYNLLKHQYCLKKNSYQTTSNVKVMLIVNID